MRVVLSSLLTCIFVFSLSISAQAESVLLFEDKFEQEALETRFFPTSTHPANWTLTSGRATVYGTNAKGKTYNDHFKRPDLGQYLRLGALDYGAVLKSKESFALAAGTYALSYLVGGANFGSSESQANLTVSILSGKDILSSLTTSVKKSSNAASTIRTVIQDFSVDELIPNVFLQFATSSEGTLRIDNIRFEQISLAATPIPAGALLFAPGLLGLVALRKRGRR